MSNINFVNAYWLLLAIPLVALFAVPFFLAVRRDNANGHNIASGVMHVVMALLIAFSAAGTNVVTTITETDVYVLADVSYSANRNLDTIDGYINSLAGSLPRNTRLGVVCFGKNQFILNRLESGRARRKSVAEAVKAGSGSEKAQIDDSETDIISALEYTATLFRADVVKRIVVISDGAQTYAEDANALKRTVDKLAAEKIKVDAIFLDDNIKEGVKEIQLSGVQLSDNVFVGRQQSVSVVIQSNGDVDAVIRLETLGENPTVTERAVPLTKGSYIASLPLDTSSVGTHEYRVSVAPENAGDDSNLFNNVRTFSQTVTDDLNVLVVAGDPSADREIDRLFREANVNAKIKCCVPGLDNVPITTEALCEYDEIILSGVEVAKIPSCELFMQSLNTVVTRFGKSLLTFGDLGLQNDIENEYGTLSQMLPVRFGGSNDLPKLFTIVIDTSSSMAELGKLARAKQAAKRLIDNLSEDDEVAIVFFNGNKGYVRRHTLVGDAAKKSELKSDIDSLWVEHGTDISLGFEMVRDLYGLDFSQKQIMLISDGLDLNIMNADYDGPLSLVDELRANNIYTSVIDIGRGNDAGAAATAAKNLLENIASSAHGGGNYYEIIDDDQFDVAFDDIQNDQTDTIVNDNSYLEVTRLRDEVLEGVDIKTNGTFVTGFVCNTKNPLGTTEVLTAIYEKEGGNKKVPIYAYRALGNGRVASFASDIEKWRERGATTQAQRDAFFTNVLTTNIPNEKVNYPFTATVEENGGYATVEITPAILNAKSRVAVRVTMPDGQTSERQLSLASTNYVYSFAMPQEGKYDIAIDYVYDNETKDSKTHTAYLNVHSGYGAEYDSFTVYDAGVLSRMVGTNGTVSLDGKLSLKNDESEVGTYTVSLVIPLLLAAVVLFIADIIVRKLKWEDIVSLFRKVKK